ncbi:DUF3999 domain-containing protein [Pseudomonas sp. LMG 31766]|uniref:DUF3999 domain-containing protein n=1 Tax=Pseudomonas chaetocerotis TaxID=2758695 RepID=A0A931CYF0_9PSED|nr:DUF3999 domain-containing protein [Pseudomonas chaetocerotis]MBZ9663769.1 DUF3999 domain-containing protein [Pseudomonas chaetocerotis]
MNLIRWGLLLGLSLSMLSQASEKPQDYRHSAALQLAGEGPWYRLELPFAAHLAAGHGDLRDLRVFDSNGQMQAYALIPGRSESVQQEQEHGVRWFPLRGRVDAQEMPALRVERSTTGTLIELRGEAPAESEQQLRGWLLDASAIDAPLVRLNLDWSGAEDGFQRFSIEASDDLQHWRSWGEGQMARLSFADERIDQRRVELPGQRARYLRLLWSNPLQAPQLQAVTLRSQRLTHQAAPLVWSEPLSAQTSVEGQYQWQLPLSLPLERLRVELEQSNTLAPLRFEARSSDQGAWRQLVSGVLYRLPEAGREVVNDALTLPGWPVRQLRMQVDARGGGLGGDMPRMQVALRATQLVFLARGEPPYRLALGNPNAPSAALPLHTLIPGYQAERLAILGRAELAEPLAASVESQAGPSQDWQRWGLWAVLLVGVGLLAAMAASVLRRPPDA